MHELASTFTTMRKIVRSWSTELKGIGTTRPAFVPRLPFVSQATCHERDIISRRLRRLYNGYFGTLHIYGLRLNGYTLSKMRLSSPAVIERLSEDILFGRGDHTSIEDTTL